MLQLGLVHLFDILHRLGDKDLFSKWAQKLAYLLESNPKACLWALRFFKQKQEKSKFVSEALLKENEKIRFAFSVFLKSAFERLAVEEEDFLLEDDSVVKQFLTLIFNKQALGMKNLMSVEQYFKMMLDFAQRGKQQTKLLISI